MIHQRSPRYVLEKKPNLLCSSLLLPLFAPGSNNDTTKALAERIGSSVGAGPRPAITKDPRHFLPYLSVERAQNETSIVRILGKASQSNQPFQYLQIIVDCPIDAERSILTVHGDHLAARLAFRDFSSARDSRNGKQVPRFLESAN